MTRHGLEDGFNPLGIKNAGRPIFHAYPGLKKVPWLPLMENIPTPVQPLDNLSKAYPGWHIWIKRDDSCSGIYGGNKPRKFEFLFADALSKGKNEIVTAGGTGTNHGLATVLFSRELGLKSKIYMFKQPLTWSVQRKLLMYANLGTDISLVSNYGELALKGLGLFLFRPKSYLILPGGSPLFGLGTVAGCLGLVNAGFELKQQVDAGIIPEPDYVFIAAGSTGSASGLILGCKLAGLKTTVVPVQVSENIVANPSSIQKNIRGTLKLMRKYDDSVPDIKVTYPGDFLFVDGYLGSAYGCVTRASQAAVDKVADTERGLGFHLETTYTGKACAAMLDFLSGKKDATGNSVALLWNTYNSRDLAPFLLTAPPSYTRLPRSFHKFFEKVAVCWQSEHCTAEKRDKCPVFMGDDNRCWMVKQLAGHDVSRCENCQTRTEIEECVHVEQ